MTGNPPRNGKLAGLDSGVACSLHAIPVLDLWQIHEAILEAVATDGRVVAFFGQPRGNDELQLFAVIATGEVGELTVGSCVVGSRFPSLTPACPQVHRFEREIAEQWSVVPVGHPALNRVRFQKPHRSGADPGPWADGSAIEPGVIDFYRVEGEQVHEVAVGPVHAGVIEPGHFRFQCHGEVVFHLEIALGYQHRGIERALTSGPTKRRLYQIETIAGDTTIGHTLAYCRALEGLAGQSVSPRVDTLRAAALELERLANHTGDLGALAADVGYLPTAAYCGRIRGEFLNATALLCGSRFGRSFLIPGGLRFDVDDERLSRLRASVIAAGRDGIEAAELLWDTPSVLGRFEGTGVVDPVTAKALGLVGMAARSCGLPIDARTGFPFGAYLETPVPISVESTGDVYARAHLRYRELTTSLDFIEAQLADLHRTTPHRGETAPSLGALAPSSFVVSLVEGWRGEVCHVAITDSGGELAHYKVVDPSFHNWNALEIALRNEEISDFPVCNKSFNLSYCGHDL